MALELETVEFSAKTDFGDDKINDTHKYAGLMTAEAYNKKRAQVEQGGEDEQLTKQELEVELKRRDDVMKAKDDAARKQREEEKKRKFQEKQKSEGGEGDSKRQKGDASKKKKKKKKKKEKGGGLSFDADAFEEG